MNGNQDIFRFNRSSSSFLQVPGQLQIVSAGGEGQVWSLNAQEEIYHLVNGTFQRQAGALKHLAVGPDGEIWGINQAQEIYCTLWFWSSNNPEYYDRCAINGTFSSIPGSLTSLTIGNWQQVWGLNARNEIYRFNHRTNRFEQIPGELKTIAAGPDEVWGVNSQNQIYRFNWSTERFEQVQGSLKTITVGFNNEIWGLNSQGRIFRYDRVNRRFEGAPGLLEQIVVGGRNEVWGVNQAGRIFRLRRP